MQFRKSFLIALMALGLATSASAQAVKPISQLPSATVPLGTAAVPVLQGGATKQAPAAAFGIPIAGSVAPTPLARYQLWWNTATNPPTWEIYDGAQWVPLGSLDLTSHVFNIEASQLTGTLSTDHLTLCCHTESSVSGTVTMTNADCGTAYLASNVAVTSIVPPASPTLECQFMLFIGTGGASFPSYIDFNGKALAAYGPGGHDMPTVQFLNQKAGAFIWVGYDGTKWTVRNCVGGCQQSFTEHLPMTVNGQVYLAYDGSQFFTVTPYNGPGWVIANGYSHRILSAGLKIDKANTTSSATNYIYLDDCGHANVTAIADNGSGKARVSATACGNIGDQVQAFIYGVPLSMTPGANGIHRATVIGAGTLDLPDVPFVAGGSFTGSARILALQFSTTGPSQGTNLNGTVQETAVSSQWAIVGQTVIGIAHSVTSTRSWFNSAVAFTGAVKSFADGSFGPAASIDLSDTAFIARAGNNLSFFSPTTSAQLAGVLSDETGSGAVVLATSPTLVTPALGTPSAINLSGVGGVTCSGAPTGSFATVNGIVTHC